MIKTLVLWACLLAAVACGGGGAGATTSEISGDGGAAMQAIVPSSQAEPPDAVAPLELPTGPLLVGIWGQSNAVGKGTYPGTFPGDSRVTYYWNGTKFPFGPVSNRHGIELALGPDLVDVVGANVVIGKGAVDATDSASWLPGNGANWPHEANTLAVMRRQTDRAVHFCMLQGESDALEGISHDQYLANLRAIATGIRVGLSPLRVIFHVGLVNSHTPGMPAPIRQAQREFASTDENADAVDFDDITPAIAPNHYDSHQLLDQIAPRFEAVILRATR